MFSLFDYAFAPTRIVVGSEERLQAAEREAKLQRLKEVDERLTSKEAANFILEPIEKG